jgi:exonuclease III
VRVATFNCEWRKPASADAQLIRERLMEQDPDIICLTEAHTGYVGEVGHTIESEPFALGRVGTSRRKVLLWSRKPWEAVDQVGSQDLPPGRYVSGTTQTPLGRVKVYGVCIPYNMAGVRYGEPKRTPWELHTAYLKGLSELIAPELARALVVGDFNQRVPRGSQPHRIYAALEQALLERFQVATAGPLGPHGLRAIDHICHSRDFVAEECSVLSNERPCGGRISDHFGVQARFALR